MTVAAFVISVLALGVALAAALFTRRQATAAEGALALARAQAAKYRSPWRLEWVKGDTFALVNDGDEPVFDVHIETPPHTAGRVEADHERVSAGSAVTFLIAFTMASPHRNMTITWARQPGGERHDWTHPLPDRD